MCLHGVEKEFISIHRIYPFSKLCKLESGYCKTPSRFYLYHHHISSTLFLFLALTSLDLLTFLCHAVWSPPFNIFPVFVSFHYVQPFFLQSFVLYIGFPNSLLCIRFSLYFKRIRLVKVIVK